jgi:hypothetical protein
VLIAKAVLCLKATTRYNGTLELPLSGGCVEAMTAADQLNQAPDSQPPAKSASDDRSQTFAFEHKVFSMAGGYFAYVKDTKDPGSRITAGNDSVVR